MQTYAVAYDLPTLCSPIPSCSCCSPCARNIQRRQKASRYRLDRFVVSRSQSPLLMLQEFFFVSLCFRNLDTISSLRPKCVRPRAAASFLKTVGDFSCSVNLDYISRGALPVPYDLVIGLQHQVPHVSGHLEALPQFRESPSVIPALSQKNGGRCSVNGEGPTVSRIVLNG